MMNEKYHHGDLRNALIDAGISILQKEGAHGLSLRKAALKAGVSHSAPYAHFKDKQALIAAISTRGLQQLYEQVHKIAEQYRTQPFTQLKEIAWRYTEFAMQDPGLFKVIFSSIIEREHDYPEFIEISHRNYELVVDVVKNNQRAGYLQQGDADLIAISIWSAVHGFIGLYLENQIPSAVLEQFKIKELLDGVLGQVITAPIER